MLDLLPLDQICGLRPSVVLCVGSGFAREDLKTLILSHKRGFVREAVMTLPEICLKITGNSMDQIMTSSSRQEILRYLLSEPRISAGFAEIKRAKRQKNFLKRLDQALQAGRLTFAHPEEEAVFHERLIQSLGENPLRVELSAFARAYEAWLGAFSWKDSVMLLRDALETLQKEGWPEKWSKPHEIWHLSVQEPESLEKEFWEVIGRFVKVKQVRSLRSSTDDLSASKPCSVHWERWHTLDDAAEAFAEEVINSFHTDNDWNQNAILIPDIPSVRRSLRRALEARRIPLAEPRDPSRLVWEESLKWALLPLIVVARNFERVKVISWLRSFHRDEEFPNWVTEINARGIRDRLQSYSGGVLAGVHSKLVELQKVLGGRKTCEEVAQSHLKLLHDCLGISGGENSDQEERSWLIPFLEGIWKNLSTDAVRVGYEKRKVPLLFWLERLQARLREASPPVTELKPRWGVRLYRLQQLPVNQGQTSRIWIFGFPPLWLSGEGAGTYWYSEREKEILSTEFAVRSSIQIREERLHILKSWLNSAEQVTVLDAQYEVDGRERGSIFPALQELGAYAGMPVPESPLEKGAHSRFQKSHGAIRPLQPQQMQLPSLPVRAGGRGPELTATLVDRYSRCSFQALAYHRWGLREVREPGTDLWPEVRGNILHEAVRLLLGSVDENGMFALTPEFALTQAWKAHRPKGLLKSPRMEKYIRTRMNQVLITFCEKEREYLKRSGATPISLEETDFRLEYPGFSIIGQPDRIDRSKKGLFIIDYKTSGTVPNGTEILEKGYRLQLPFYAAAARALYKAPVNGVQYVELDRKGNRKSGIFFKQFNGKEEGCLTQLRANSKSLVSLEPDEAWDLLEEHLIQDASQYIQGIFQARPKTSIRSDDGGVGAATAKECSRCGVADLCGKRRRVEL